MPASQVVPDNDRVDQDPVIAEQLGSDPRSLPLEDPAAVAAQREERARRRLRQTARDMLLSMLVVAAGVLLLAFPFGRGAPDPIKVIDPAPVVAAAREELGWPVLAPTGLPATWRATSARLDVAADGETVLHVGYLSPSTRYIGLEQSATKETAFVRDQTLGGRPVGEVVIGGTTWQRLESPDGERKSLLRVGDGATYVVTGAAPWTELDALTASLRPG